MSEKLTDGKGRVVDYLRLSVTDRCNLSCSYCIPPGGANVAPSCDMLQYRDFLKLVEIFAELGVNKVRVTGGEPLVRKGITSFIRQVKDITGIEQIALTTNGMMLHQMANELKRAGVIRVNISLDSLQSERYHKITKRDGFRAALDGIESAMKAGFESVKINMVVIGGVNDDEIVEFAKKSITMNVQVRFIEFMPVTHEVWDEGRLVPMTDVKRRVEKLGRLIPVGKRSGNGPAEIYKVEGSIGEVGFISAVSRHFCEDCNRLRLTSTGQLLTCLFSQNSLDLKAMLTDGADRESIKQAIRDALLNKSAVRNMEKGARATMSLVGG